METPTGGGRDSRFNMGYNMSLLSGETSPEMYGAPHSRPSTSVSAAVSRSGMSLASACGAGMQRGLKRASSDGCFGQEQDVSGARPGMSAGQSALGLPSDCGGDMGDDAFSQAHKKTPPPNGKKTKGRVKIKMEYIDNKLRRYTTFSKRKTGIMKKAYELSTLTGTQVMLLVASETGHVYTFATRKLQPMITSEAGKALIQTCLNSPDPPAGGVGGDQRMSATGFEETELTYNIGDDEQKVRQLVYGSSPHSHAHAHAHGHVHAHGLQHMGAGGPPPPQQQHPHTHAHTHTQHFQQAHPGGSPHHHLMAAPHPQSPPAHLLPCSSPGPMLGGGAGGSGGGYHPQLSPHGSCPSPLPPHPGYPPPPPHPPQSHSHPQR